MTTKRKSVIFSTNNPPKSSKKQQYKEKEERLREKVLRKIQEEFKTLQAQWLSKEIALEVLLELEKQLKEGSEERNTTPSKESNFSLVD